MQQQLSQAKKNYQGKISIIQIFETENIYRMFSFFSTNSSGDLLERLKPTIVSTTLWAVSLYLLDNHFILTKAKCFLKQQKFHNKVTRANRCVNANFPTFVAFLFKKVMI